MHVHKLKWSAVPMTPSTHLQPLCEMRADAPRAVVSEQRQAVIRAIRSEEIRDSDLVTEIGIAVRTTSAQSISVTIRTSRLVTSRRESRTISHRGANERCINAWALMREALAEAAAYTW